MGFLYYLLSFLLAIWPFKHRRQVACRERARRPSGRWHDPRVTEYAIWLPFLGWGSIWAINRGVDAIPRWQLVDCRFDFQSTDDRPGNGSRHQARHTQMHPVRSDQDG